MILKSNLFRAVIIAVLALPIVYVYQHLNITTSESLEDRFYWMVEGAPQKGDFVMFELSHPLIGDHPTRLTKKLICWEGDLLEVKGRDYFCNGEFIGSAKEKSRKGAVLPQFTFNGTIPEGKAFASGQHKDSFDSRYWGFIDLEVGHIQRLKVL